MKTPTQILSAEHKNILKITDALNQKCAEIEAGKPVDKKFFQKAVEFIHNYADKFHHAKEEKILFKELNKNAGALPFNPVSQMLAEHKMGRAFVKTLETGLKTGNRNKIVEGALGFAELLPEHIFKEDNILYPMANNILSQETQKKMLAKFMAIEKENSARTKKYLDFVKEAQKRKK